MNVERTAETGTNVAVSIAGVSKVYDRGGVAALSDVSLTIFQGEFFSLLGPSGCGKTSLLRIIGGFEQSTSGRVMIDGVDVGDTAPYARSTNMIFQHLALFPHMTVFENIAFGLRRKKMPNNEIADRVRGALALVRLADYGERMPDQLSGGQRQRVAMARAMVNEPSVLLLDEPLAALDLQLRIQMQEELRRLHKSTGRTFIYVTHDQGEAMSMSDRIGVMHGGRLQQVGTPEDIYNRPRTRFVASFIGHTNMLDGVVTSIGDEAFVRIDCKGVGLMAKSHGALTVGQPVTAAFRYERLKVAPAADPNVFASGRVVERIYLGQSIRLAVELTNGAVVTADLREAPEFSPVSVGDNVSLAIPPQSVVALTE
ncbi:ABC transporter ATP-binding protein [Rhodoplanes sp. Z2-YC6860]|uniref:ABC transporter ATP-binding protein n=1 Tax=Rhodoplanes sp. Z2-YC6860 TaxID=674703 RepID=UPI00078C7DB3|nr:ABC transporter ATP-binding protein [Rhodoplanes sp. Z2-YC6860]AMN44004.1 putrescine ABC transporter ATP-binding protein [Rhodoplanes sp. Z2-YC6860]